MTISTDGDRKTLPALESHLENALDQGVRVIYERVKSLNETHRVLGRELEPLKRLVTQSAEDAAETRSQVRPALSLCHPAPAGDRW